MLDNDVPESVRDVLGNHGSLHLCFSRDMHPNGADAKDIEILLWAAEHNWHLVTCDKGFLNPMSHPCTHGKYAKRTVVRTSSEWDMAETLISAWRQVTWNGLRNYDAIEIQDGHIVAYKCGGKQYNEVARWNR
jgi:predicted nuclease of predicted toxin-antitoxin system